MPQGMTERGKYTLSAPVCELGHLSQRERQAMQQYSLNYNLAHSLRCRKQRSFFVGKLLVDDRFQKTVQSLTDGSALNAQ